VCGGFRDPLGGAVAVWRRRQLALFVLFQAKTGTFSGVKTGQIVNGKKRSEKNGLCVILLLKNLI